MNKIPWKAKRLLTKRNQRKRSTQRKAPKTQPGIGGDEERSWESINFKP